jgi:transposase-like protein
MPNGTWYTILMNRRIVDEAAKEQMVASYRRGMCVRDIAADMGFERTTVYKWLNRAGIAIQLIRVGITTPTVM